MTTPAPNPSGWQQFHVRAFGRVTSEGGPVSAANDFIEKINQLGIRNFYFHVADEFGHEWMINTSDLRPVFMTMKEWRATQTSVGLDTPPEVEAEDDEPEIPVAPPAAVPAAPVARRPTRKRAAPPATPPEERPTPTDARQAVHDHLARRRAGT